MHVLENFFLAYTSFLRMRHTVYFFYFGCIQLFLCASLIFLCDIFASRTTVGFLQVSHSSGTPPSIAWTSTFCGVGQGQGRVRSHQQMVQITQEKASISDLSLYLDCDRLLFPRFSVLEHLRSRKLSEGFAGEEGREGLCDTNKPVRLLPHILMHLALKCH